MLQGLWKRINTKRSDRCDDDSLSERGGADGEDDDGSCCRRPPRKKLFGRGNSTAKTAFPDFDSSGDVPEGELTEISDDEDSLSVQHEKYRTKEDEDVAVFLNLCKRMSLRSLVFLLEGQAKAQNLDTKYLQSYKEAAELEPRVESKPLAKHKKFRWCLVKGDTEVKTVVHEVESIKDYKGLWWDQDEMHEIRREVVHAVRFFKNHRPDYIAAVESVARANEPEHVLDEKMKMLTHDSFARGMESHIVHFLSDNRKSTVHAVLQEQTDCRQSGDDYDISSVCLREQSIAYSKMSTDFAARMGRCDHVEALKASMSRWRASSPAIAKKEFFSMA